MFKKEWSGKVSDEELSEQKHKLWSRLIDEEGPLQDKKTTGGKTLCGRPATGKQPAQEKGTGWRELCKCMRAR